MDGNLKKILAEEKLTLRALNFAVYAHDGQFRKLNQDIPYVVHPIKVARIVDESREPYVNKYLIAAAYLHDVVEDTGYSLDFIEEFFGYRVKNYVKVMTEKDKSISWEERKQETIDKIHTLNEDEKLLMLADKLANIEDMNDFFRDNDKDFSKFHRGEEQQEWYYRNLYKELVKDQDENKKLFRLFRNNINEVFGRTMEEYFKNEDVKIKKKEFNN